MNIQSVGEALIRPGQVLTDRAALSAASRWTQAVSEADGVCVLHLTDGADPREVTAELRDQGIRASPNHVLRGQPCSSAVPPPGRSPLPLSPSNPAGPAPTWSWACSTPAWPTIPGGRAPTGTPASAPRRPTPPRARRRGTARSSPVC
ncbi:hypothetical protein ACFQYP_04860 [Nonomuraea antimicrobica]